MYTLYQAAHRRESVKSEVSSVLVALLITVSVHDSLQANLDVVLVLTGARVERLCSPREVGVVASVTSRHPGRMPGSIPRCAARAGAYDDVREDDALQEARRLGPGSARKVPTYDKRTNLVRHR